MIGNGVYATLANNKLLLQKGEAAKWDFHQGVALVMRAFNFGNIADWWGDAPDSLALNGSVGGTENLFPVFDSQQSIYERVIADLKAAITHFNGSQLDHPEITGTTIASDVFYQGDPAKWQKFAYSLLLRYYLRLSSKMDVQASVEGIAANVFKAMMMIVRCHSPVLIRILLISSAQNSISHRVTTEIKCAVP